MATSLQQPLQLCMFDMTRGQQDGQELDKILFFYPLECPLPLQLSVIGLSEGLITFSRIFSSDAPCEVMEAERHSHIFYQCEPEIWMIMVVEKSKEAESSIRPRALQMVLKEVHGLFTMFYGSVRALLQNYPSEDVARSCLYAFFPDYISSEFMNGKKLKLPSVKESLTERGTVQSLSFDRHALLEAQSLVNLLKSWLGGGTIRHVLILYHNHLVSSSLPAGDTARLFVYALLRMTPSVIARSSAHSSSRLFSFKGYGSPAKTNAESMQNNNDESLNTPASSRDTSPVGQRGKPQVPRPLLQDAWSRDPDGFLSTDAWGAGARGGSAVIPSIWLQQSEERMQMVAYQHKALTLLMLLPTNASVGGVEGLSLLRQQLLEKAVQKIEKLELTLTREWGGTNSSHVPGYRYLYCDLNNKMSRSSPPAKVSTLSKDSLIALNSVRTEVDLEISRAERNDNGAGRDLEFCVRAHNNSWVAVRARDGHELYLVLERASDTLLLASEAVEKFNKRYCDGRFASD
ncbi:hypothetical protein O6H91_03G011400 [Diphasiastrum complanatum]|uniref:Uncharacterized protein n=4 Tax=Diphasiastrum complanatum TaxID=34168 RepID=A0ACC2E3I1_DIPCM|nr:hypothetical protein O6H91_03G011400 [Diphasiastrum complanatum]KAJ7561041.1 hypothetical protein O6H91_03G011400 [Diphasiastrum complanatum]KAJ7561042.1 hypothetical protein O6H91_03G011400 [Diphasiastrum complanatum]KAJ7561043.1 hypothetical protein O6H91_03G011400 [Diphasiastrum complanatum]